MKTNRRLTAHDFDVIRPFLDDISADRVEAARMFLVDCKTMSSIAPLFGCSKQAVDKSVTIVWDVYQKYCESQRVASSQKPKQATRKRAQASVPTES